MTTFGVSTWRLTVDGQTFAVTARPGSPGTYDFNWLSGPNPGYGFTSQRNDHQEMNARELTHAVRTFLAQIDPDTGYIS